MDNSRKNVLVTFSRRAGTRNVYFLALAFAALVGITAYLMLPATNVGTVAAQSSDEVDASLERALDFALNFKSASDTAVSGKSVRGVEASNLRGTMADKKSRNMDVVARDINMSLDAIAQLPCTNLKETSLSGKSFGRGVYCMSASDLDGELMLDANGDTSARFVFRVEGSFKASAGSRVSLTNGAQATNVYFVAADAVVGADSNIQGSIVTKGNVNVGAGSTIGGKVFSAEGSIDLNNAVAGPGTGFLEICKNVTFTDTRLAGRIYTFVVGGQTVQVPVGACSAPIQVTAGPTVVTELLRPNSRLWNVVGRDAAGNPVPITNINQFTQQATINVPVGNAANQVVIEFQNVFGRIGVIEICKRAVGPDVSGFFEYNVFGNPGITYSVPVGQCSPPIAVNTDLFVDINGTNQPATYVTEIGRPGFTLIDISTIPAERLIAEFYGIGINDQYPPLTPFANPGGGVALVWMREVTGVTLNDPIPPGFQTTINFFNMGNPGQLKVCKIAGPGINTNVLFRFEVTGTRLAANATFPNPAMESFTTTVDVPAGPAAQGGFCQFVDGRFVLGSNIRVTELGVSPANTVAITPGSAATQSVPAGTSIRVSRIRCTPFTCQQVQLGAVPTPAAATANSTLPFGIVQARAATVEIEFVDFLFRPTLLKICKTGPPGSYTFNVGVDPNGEFGPLFTPSQPGNVNPFPARTLTLTLEAGGPATVCDYVNGPFPPFGGGTGTATNPGTFPVGIDLLITEPQTNPATTVQAITSPTAAPAVPGGTQIIATNLTNAAVGTLPARTARVRLGGSNPYDVNFINEVFFTNTAAGAVDAAVRFDFDGDKKSDPSVWTPSNGNWAYIGSSSGLKSRPFGQAGDKLVSADYDGDGKYDYGIYRNGTWYILLQTGGYYSFNWGVDGDIPQVGDYDGDGKADPTVYRPSTGQWFFWKSREGFASIAWGVSTDKPLAADYDGDGKTDPTVNRGGTWYIFGSASGIRAFDFGIPGDVFVPADYDGDAKADAGVFRNGTWYLLGSTIGYKVVSFGMAGDVPVAADYDGDKKADLAVFRASEGKWYILPTDTSASATPGMTSLSFGTAEDVAVQAQ